MQARVRFGAFVAVMALFPAVAFGQAPPPATPPPAEAAPPPANVPADAPPAADVPPAADAPPADAPAAAPPPKHKGKARPHHAPTGLVATYPGFQMMNDGGSRVFVQLSQTAQVEEKRGPGSITYIIKGAKILHHNNGNALVTTHFNTPVVRARLVPSGRDLKFVIDLRSPVSPTFRVDAEEDNSATLNIDFPKGEYLGTAPSRKAAKSAPAPAQEPNEEPQP